MYICVCTHADVHVSRLRYRERERERERERDLLGTVSITVQILVGNCMPFLHGIVSKSVIFLCLLVLVRQRKAGTFGRLVRGLLKEYQ